VDVVADQVADRDAMLRGIAHHKVIEFPSGPATTGPATTAPATTGAAATVPTTHAASAG
jgi:hypothetical protein